MTATAHALVAGAIAANISNPAAGITLSFISHPLLDLIPHWDAGVGWRQKTKKRLFLEGASDLALGLSLAYIIFGQGVDLWYFLACIFASVVLDLAEIPYWFFKWNFAPFSWIYNFQHSIQGRAKLPWGIVTQVISLWVVLLILQSVKA